VFAIEARDDGVYVQTPPTMPRKLINHMPSHLLEEHARDGSVAPRALRSTTAMDDGEPPLLHVDALLEHRASTRPSGAAPTRSTSSCAT